MLKLSAYGAMPFRTIMIFDVYFSGVILHICKVIEYNMHKDLKLDFDAMF